MTWKVTPSLYSSWMFYAKPMFDRTPEQELAARQEFIRVLKKIPGEETDAIRRGVLFEKLIMDVVKGGTLSIPEDEGVDGQRLLCDNDLQCAINIAAMCRDGVFQIKDGRELPSGNYIYGISDCIMLNGGFDFKRVGEYEMGKYLKSIQHWAYMYIWTLPQFHYLVGDGSPEPFIEPYTWNERSLGLLEGRICEMIHWINCDPELREIFAEHWTYKKGETDENL